MQRDFALLGKVSPCLHGVFEKTQMLVDFLNLVKRPDLMEIPLDSDYDDKTIDEVLFPYGVPSEFICSMLFKFSMLKKLLHVCQLDEG